MSNYLRPSSFDEIIGQDETINNLKIAIAGCEDGGVLSHTLIDGPPGLGKTTIAKAIARELNEKLTVLNAASIRSVANLTPYLLAATQRSVLFIDEIHRLPKIVEEFLYPVMEDFIVTVVQEKVPETIDLPRFTIIGATTSGGSLSRPFYDRFTIKEHLSFYSSDELANLARLNAPKFGLSLSDEQALKIASRSKGTPRVLNARIQRYKDYTKFYKDRDVSVEEVFDSQGINSLGFDKNDMAYINCLKNNRNNPLGVKSISVMTGIPIETVENNIEPYMIRMGYVVRTSKGRILGKNV